MIVWFTCPITQVVSPWQKPLKLLTHLIRLHGCPTDKWDKFVLDVGCGSGSTSLGALFCGMSAIAFDMDPHCVGGTKARLRNWVDTGIDSDSFTADELHKLSKTKKRNKALKRKREDDDGDEDDIDDDSADDIIDDEAVEDVEKEKEKEKSYAPALDAEKVKRLLAGEVEEEQLAAVAVEATVLAAEAE